MSNGVVVVPIVFGFLVSTCLFSQNLGVSGSFVRETNFMRHDPLHHFKHYNGSFDLRNKHYWASTAFTGVHGYAIAGVWLVSGVGFGIFLAVKQLARKKNDWTLNKAFLNYHFFIMFYLVLFFTFLTIVASSLALSTSHSFLKRTERMIKCILSVGGDVQGSINIVSKSIAHIQGLLQPYQPQVIVSLNQIKKKLKKESRVIRSFVHNNGPRIDRAIRSFYVLHVVVVAVNMVLVLTALVMILLHWNPGFFIIIFLCWLLTTLCWVLTGFDLFLHNFSKDTCYAFESYGKNPQNNSLSTMMPCMNPSYSAKVMDQVGSTVHSFINQMNSKIAEVSKTLGSDDENIFHLIQICNPFTDKPQFKYSPESCPPNSIPVKELPSILEGLACLNSDVETCNSEGRYIPENDYKMALAYTRSIQDILDIIPTLQSLTQCGIVKDKFSYVAAHLCRPFRVSARLQWSSLLSLSILMVILVLIWIAKAYQDRGRRFSTYSITPKPHNK